MIRKQDIASLTGWSLEGGFANSIIPLTIAVVSTSLLEFMQDRVAIDFESIIVGGFAAAGAARDGCRHVVSLRNNYRPQELKWATGLIVPLVAGLCTSAYGAIGELVSKYALHAEGVNVAGVSGAMFIYGLTIAAFINTVFEIDTQTGRSIEGLNIAALRQREQYGLETLERKNEKALKIALEKIQTSNDNVYELLEKYNKVYKRKFTKLGTVIEMADRANDKDLKKELQIKNNELILCALLNYNNAKNKDLESIVVMK